MKKIFDMDNPIWEIVGKCVDMSIITCLWCVCSLPIVTVGAATAALYESAWHLSNNQDGYVINQFFKALKKKMKQGIGAGTIIIFVGGVLMGDLYAASQMQGSGGKLLVWVFLMLIVIYLLIVTFFFPLQARYNASLKRLFAAAFIFAFKHIGWTVFMLVSAVCLISVAVFSMAPLCVCVPGIIAYIHSKVLNHILKEHNICYIQN